MRREARVEQLTRGFVAVCDQRPEMLSQGSVAAEQMPLQPAVPFDNPRILRSVGDESFEQAGARCAERVNVLVEKGRPVGTCERSRTRRRQGSARSHVEEEPGQSIFGDESKRAIDR